jgi:hypothetical protein
VISTHSYIILVFFILLNGTRLSPLGTAATISLLYQPQMIDSGDCGAFGGIKADRRNRNTRRNPAPVSLCPPQIPNDMTRARTRAAAVEASHQPPEVWHGHAWLPLKSQSICLLSEIFVTRFSYFRRISRKVSHFSFHNFTT